MFKIMAEHEKFNYIGYFDNQFTMVLLFIRFFEETLRVNGMQKIVESLEENMIAPALWLHKWVITNFVYDFPVFSALRVWDMYF